MSTEMLFLIVMLLVSAGALLPLLGLDLSSTTYDPTTIRNPLTRPLLITGSSIMVYVLLVKKWRQPVSLNLLGLTPLLAFVAASTAWSVAPRATAGAVVFIACLTIVGVYLAARFSRREQLVILSWALLAALLASAVMVTVSAELGIDRVPASPGWRGVFLTKNVLGRIAALSLIVVVLGWRTLPRLPRLLLGLLAVISLLMAQSATSLLVLVLTVVVVIGQVTLRRASSSMKPLYGCLFVTGIVASAVWLVANTASLTESLGRDVSLTGRTGLWDLSISYAYERAWFGYGYGAFWRGGIGPSGTIAGHVKFVPPHAHNGWIDLWLHVGALGAIAFSLIFLAVYARARRLIRPGIHGDSASWPLAFLTFMLLYNLTESSFFNGLMYVVLVMVVADLSASRLPRGPLVASSDDPAPIDSPSRRVSERAFPDSVA